MRVPFPRKKEIAMSEGHSQPAGPDLALGVSIDSIADGAMLAGHVGDDAVLIARRGHEFFAVGATCTHYGGPLAEGLLVGDTLRCPWHHACFSLRTGEALRAPALNAVSTWSVEQRGALVFVVNKHHRARGGRRRASRTPAAPAPSSIVIVGGGAAGNAGAEMLRREGYRGAITMVSADGSLPYDRPNLSKDFLAGNAPEDWIPLRTAEFYAENKIDVILGTRVDAIDVAARRVALHDGRTLAFDRLLLATGAEPARLVLPGGDLGHVHYLRTLDDSRAIISALGKDVRRVVVIGAGFIGLEVAAALRTRGLAVDVVAPENQPLERILGPQVGAFIRALHEREGVTFHLGQSATA